MEAEGRRGWRRVSEERRKGERRRVQRSKVKLAAGRRGESKW